jgi:hypothetical protein
MDFYRLHKFLIPKFQTSQLISGVGGWVLKKRRHSRLLPTGRGKEVTAQEGFLWPELLLLTCFDSRGRSAVDLCLAFSESRKDRMSEFLILDLRATLRCALVRSRDSPKPYSHFYRFKALIPCNIFCMYTLYSFNFNV